MDNVIVGEAAIAQIVEAGEAAPAIRYVQNLLGRAKEQQLAGCNSQGRVYSGHTSNRAGSTGRGGSRHIANVQNCPPPAP